MEEVTREHGMYAVSDPGSTTNASSVSVRLYDEGEFFDREELGERLSAPKNKRKCGRKSKNKKKARDILTTSTDRPKPSLPFENDAGEDTPPLDLFGTRNFRAPIVMQQNTETSSENIQIGALQPNQDAPAQASSRIAAPELPLDHPLAPNLAKPDDLNARIRENFKQDNAEEGETVRNDSKNFPAILLGKDLIPITEHDGEKINTSVKLRIDEVRPHIRIVASRKSKDDYNLADQFVVSKELGAEEQKEARIANPHLVRPYVVDIIRQGMAVQVSARFGYQAVALSQLVPLTRELMEAKPDEYAHLPQQLRDAAHQLEDVRDAFPLLLNIFHTSDHVITENLGTSAPPWAVAFGEAVFQTISTINTLLDVIVQEGDPLDKFHRTKGNAKKKDLYNLYEFNPSPKVQTKLGFRPFYSFRDEREYCTVMYAASILEQADAKLRIDNFEVKDHILHLIPLPNQQGGIAQVYYGFIDEPEQEECRLRQGDALQINFDQDQPLILSTKVYWSALVDRPISCSPPGKRTLIVYRAWIKDVQNETADWDRHEPKVIEPRHGGDRKKLAQEISEEIQHISGNVVRLKVINPVDKDKLNSYDRLINPSDQLPLTDYNRNLVDVLLGGRHDKLKKYDLYKSIRTSFTDATWAAFLGELNAKQQDIMQACQSMPGNLLPIIGPPGTGKSFLAAHILIPFLLAGSRTLSLVCTPTNIGADSFAHNLQKELAHLVKSFPKITYLTDRYVLRLHSSASEVAIQESEHFAERRSNMKYDLSRPKAFSSSDDLADEQLTAAELEISMRQGYDLSQATNFEYVKDKRVTDKSYSVGMMMLMVGGVIPGTQWEDKTEGFETFKSYYRQWRQGDILDAAAKQEFNREKELLYSHVLRRASVVVSTTAGINSNKFLRHVRDRVVAILIDEAAQTREDGLSPLIATPFVHEPGWIMIGDHNQIAPIVVSGPQDNVFGSQLEISAMERMIKCGHPSLSINEQQRMVPDIADLCRAMKYGASLTDGAATALEFRPIARTCRAWAQKLLGGKPENATNVVWVDPQKSVFNVVEMDNKHSRKNELLVCAAISMVKDFLAWDNGATIFILTPYSLDKEVLDRIYVTMRARGVENLHNLTCDTIDKLQGQEADIVIGLLPISEKMSMMGDPRRTMTLVSRARNLLILCGSRRDITKARGLAPEFAALLTHFGPNQTLKWNVPKEDWQIPGQEYHTPSFAKTTRSLPYA